MEFLRLKVEMELLIISRCDILNRTAEMARLYGIQFYDVLSRGSQVGQRPSRILDVIFLKNYHLVSCRIDDVTHDSQRELRGAIS